MTEQTIKMWETWADPREMFVWALFHHKPEERERFFTLIEADGDEQAGLILDWMDKLHLSKTPWFLEQAVNVASKSLQTPPLQWSLPPPPFECSGWDRKNESRRVYEEGVKAALTAYCDAIEARAKERGDVPPEEKRNPQHFVWAVKYFIDGMKTEQIAAQEGVSQQSADAGVRSVAHLIGLEMRKRG